MKMLTADEGKVYTNGETYGREICLPDFLTHLRGGRLMNQSKERS